MAFVVDEPRRLVPAHAFARTYSSRVYDDAWAAVEDYRQVQSLADEADGKPSPRGISDELDLPRGRVYPWLHDSRPDAVRGLEAARERGWIDVSTDSDVFGGLNVMVAWIYASGSISADTYSPYFVIDGDSDAAILTAAAELANAELRETRSGKNGRTRELRPPEAAAVLGRTLSVLGAPVGRKNAESVPGLPDYLTHVEDRVAREFVQTYVHKRGEAGDDGELVLVRERRNGGYLTALARLVRRLTGESLSIGEDDVVLSAAAARKLENWEPLLGVAD